MVGHINIYRFVDKEKHIIPIGAKDLKKAVDILNLFHKDFVYVSVRVQSMNVLASIDNEPEFEKKTNDEIDVE